MSKSDRAVAVWSLRSFAKSLLVLAALVAPGCVLFGPSEEEIKAEFDAYVAGANICAADADCGLAYPGCPLGCWVAVRKDRIDDVNAKARDLLDDYGRTCDYDCTAPSPVTCMAGRCEAHAQ